MARFRQYDRLLWALVRRRGLLLASAHRTSAARDEKRRFGALVRTAPVRTRGRGSGGDPHPARLGRSCRPRRRRRGGRLYPSDIRQLGPSRRSVGHRAQRRHGLRGGALTAPIDRSLQSERAETPPANRATKGHSSIQHFFAPPLALLQAHFFLMSPTVSSLARVGLAKV
jgi:hypothetical protein